MPKIPTAAPNHPIVELVYEAWRTGARGRHGNEPRHRWHLGGSQLGKECRRMLWYGFRWVDAADFEGRMLRLFDRGDVEEPRIVADLRAIGADVAEISDDGRQIRHAWHGGHLGQSIDGIARNLPGYEETLVLEFKTMSAKNWQKVTTQGVKKSHPHYYAQCQLALEGQGLVRCLFVSVNKDTDAIHVEVIEFDPIEAARLISVGVAVVEATVPPAKISEDASFWKCKFCDFADVCHYGKAAEVNCRTCAHSTPVQTGDSGDWRCDLPEGAQAEIADCSGCAAHVFNPDLVRLETIDADGKSVTYTEGEGTVTNGGPGGLPSSTFAAHLDETNPLLP